MSVAYVSGPPIPVHRKEHQRRHEKRADDERVHERRRDEHEAELVQHWRVAQEQLQAQHATSAVSDACPPDRKTLECKTRAGDNTRGFKSTQHPNFAHFPPFFARSLQENKDDAVEWRLR